MRPDTAAVVEVLTRHREKADVPGMVAGIIRGDKLVAAGAAGVRKSGDPAPITADDLVHLGSNTKSMTATMIATLVEEGKLDWDTPLAKLFPQEAEAWHADWRGVTLHQLLTHTASLPPNTEYFALPGRTTTDKRRALLTRKWWKEAPDNAPGTRHRYSNVGYLLAALMAEQVTHKSWEELMRERLFKPLGMTRTGFGAPGTKGKADQPWGHTAKDGKHTPSQGDNAPVMGPAGTVHTSLADWAKFVVQHLHGEEGGAGAKPLLKPETFRKLHAPVLEDYACGWKYVRMPGNPTRYLWHNGSNTFWYAEMWLDPKNDLAVLVAANQGGSEAQRAVRTAATELVRLANK